ncbi:RDD family protein [Photobacterium sanguinicancri]|uniref:RDD family protein n=1 Tax=Photobacterium sanguinicancri TaxID=875932 RepID=UPI0026E3C9D1|nr:RDD family protein [Photobacterium sanguinicancri]MDO6497010.1 RDD family protein [Photobacterium sanguinicancri]
MRYAGYWKRFGAGCIDGIVLIPIFILFDSIESSSKEIALFMVFPSAGMFLLYNIYFHGRWGATLGKMAMKIKVVKWFDESDISYKESVLRFSVDLVFALIVAISNFMVINALSADEYMAINLLDKGEFFYTNSPSWMFYVNILSFLWMVSELFILLCNEKKRALHDFIAGTVVICR